MSDPLALLMSDLVDSTGTTQRLGPVASERLWAEHDRMARALLASWGGIEVDKSDGFLLIFGEARDAARYALAYHQALTRLPEPVSARIGIHVAPVAVRPNNDAEVASGAKPFEIENWMAKALTSRLMSLARSGQTLLSAAAAASMAGSPQRLRSHGHWRAQGLPDPIEVFEVGDARTAFEPPADAPKVWRVVERSGVWLPVRDVRHSLPSEPDAFVGRTRDLLDLADALDSGARLCTVLGTGGIGKTRLALRLGWQRLGDHAGGVWFCDLSTALDRDGLLYAVAQGLQIGLDQADPVAQTGQTIAARGRCLVILDNFDRLTAWAGDTLKRWMQLAPDARFLVTSRQVLSLPGEQTFPLAPLAVADAVDLFERRAQAAAPDRTVPGAGDSVVADLVQMLDGLPLAIELAAARVRVMSPRNMLDRMGQRFRLLAAPGRPLQRQATLRAALDWSWELLSVAERRALAQLSVFEGSFTLDDAEAVLDPGDEPDAPWTPDLLQSLVEKSMLRTRGSERFDLLRNMQEYTAEHLATPGRFPGSGPDGLAAAQARHWRHFATLDEAAIVADDGAAIDNLAAACRRAAAAGDGAAAAGALVGSWVVLRRTGPFRAALDLAAPVQALSGLPAATRTQVERVAGSASELLGHADAARDGFEAALRLAREAGDACAEGWSSVSLGEHLYKRGQLDEARATVETALRLADHRLALRCAALNALGTLEMRQGRAERARTAYEAALPLARELGEPGRIGGLLGNLAILADESGEVERALDLYEQALTLTVRGQDRRWEGNTRCNLGLLLQACGRSDEAQVQFQQSLAIACELGHAMLEATVLCNLGILLDARDDLAGARAHHERALAVAQRLGDKRGAGQFNGYLGETLARTGAVEEGLVRLADGESALRAVGDEPSLALLLCQRALAEFLAGRDNQAIGRLAALRVSARAEGAADLRRAIDRADRLMTRR